MPRLARLPFVPFGWYYVVLRSVPGRRIIASEADLSAALRLLRRTLRKKGASIHAAYIGEREIHLALQVREVPLSAITGGFQHEYARVFNRTHDEQGSLFRLHYYALLIDHKRWLVPLVRFIHWIHRLDAQDDGAGSLWWSSDVVYRGGEQRDWVTTNLVFRLLARRDRGNQDPYEAYRRVSDTAPDPSDAHSFRHGSAEDSRFLGDPPFTVDVWRRTGRRSPDRARRAPHIEGDIRAVLTQMIDRFTAFCDKRLPRDQAAIWSHLVTYEKLRSRSRKRPLPMVRALSVSYLIMHKIATPTQAAHFFGCSLRSVSARRRRFYLALFHKWFGVKPEVLFALRGDDPGPRR